MIGYEIRVEGLDEQLEKFRRFAPIVEARFKPAMTRSLIHMRNHTIPFVPVFTGRLQDSLTDARSTTVQVTAPMSVVGRFGSTLRDEIYPVIMEFGRKPGKMPPPQALERWVHIKLGVPVEDAPGVAFQVARRIGARGIKGKKFMARGWKAARPLIVQEFDYALRKISEDLSNGRN